VGLRRARCLQQLQQLTDTRLRRNAGRLKSRFHFNFAGACCGACAPAFGHLWAPRVVVLAWCLALQPCRRALHVAHAQPPRLTPRTHSRP
jgi:hypothetical protein